MLSQIVNRCRKVSRKSKNHIRGRVARRRNLFVESLEDRRLLAVDTLYWGSPGVLNTGTGGAVNSMNTDGTNIQYNLVSHTNGQGRALAVDGNLDLVFYSSWNIGNPSFGGAISVHDLNGGGTTQILSDPTTGIPDIELDLDAQRIYWTDFVRGEIRSASYDAAGNLGAITTEVSGRTNPFGLAIEEGAGPSTPVINFYWSETTSWSAPGFGGAVYTSDATGAPVMTIASGYARVDDVELDPLADKLYWNNWASVPGNSGSAEGIYRSNLDGTGLVQVTNVTQSNSTATGAAGLHGIALDPANEVIYFTRGVSYAGPHEVASVNFDGSGYTQLNVTSDGWFVSGIALDAANTAPVLTNVALTPTSINEGSAATLSGTVTDAEGGPYTLVVDWGEGSPQTITLPANATTFSVPHTYLDDNPTATLSDPYNVEILSLTDPEGAAAVLHNGSSFSTNLTGDISNSDFNNATSDPFSPITTDEITLTNAGIAHSHGGSVSVFLDLHDPGTGTWTQVFTTSVTGSISFNNQTFVLPVQTFDRIRFRSVPGQNQTFHSWGGNVTLTLPNNSTRSLTVSNVAPVANAGANQTVDEGDLVTLNGTFTDVGLDDGHKQEWTVVASNGESISPQTTNNLAGDSNGSGGSSFSFTPGDNGTYTVTYKVTDDDGGVHSDVSVITVNNVDPVLSNVSITSPIDEDDSATLTGNISDVGTLDTLTLDVGWGDGNVDTFSYPAGTTSFSESHQYLDDDPTVTSSDDYDVTVTLKDDDGGTATNIGAGGQPQYFPFGPQANVPDSDLEGWEVCWSSLYGVGGHAFSDVLADCDGDYLLLAGGPVDSNVFDVVAAGERADVLFDTGTGNTPHNANGVGWYFSQNYSMGFAKEGDPLNRTSCDAPEFLGVPDNPELRLCWHTGSNSIQSGWRSGANIWLNSSSSFERFIYQPASVDLLTITVNNVNPVANAGADQTVNEGDLVTLSGSFTDQGTDDGHKQEWTVVASNGESIAPQTTDNLTGDSNGSGGSSFSFTPGDDGTYTVTYTVTDDDGGVHSDVSVITVNNVNPEILTLSATSVNEDGTVTLTGTYSDDGSLDTHTIDVNWGEGAPEIVAVIGGKFSVQHQYLDDNPTGTPSDVYTISVVLTDDDSGTDTDATTTTISNVAPTITSFTGPMTNVVQGQLLSYSATFSDVGTLDTHTAVFNWGDATSSPGVVTESGGSGSVSGSHIYTAAGTYTITLTVTDDDTGAVSSTKQVVVSVVAIGEGCCETNALLIGGTLGNDTIRVVPQGKQTGASTDVVKVLINGQDQGTYTGFGKIVMIGQAGDDDMEIAGSIKHDACLFGEAGNDRLKGSGGNNIILGGSGDDMLLGDNNSLSLMIGGTGSDRLIGNAGSDILVAGTTDHDDNDAALCAIMAQWSSSADYNTRVAAISAWLNSSTVHDDGAEDKLTGAAGLDLFFANLSGGSVFDKITDEHAAEFAFDES